MVIVITETKSHEFLYDTLARDRILGHQSFLTVLRRCHSIVAVEKKVASPIVIALHIVFYLCT